MRRAGVSLWTDDDETHSGDDGAAEVLQVGDDASVFLHVSVLDELCEVLFSNACGGLIER